MNEPLGRRIGYGWSDGEEAQDSAQDQALRDAGCNLILTDLTNRTPLDRLGLKYVINQLNPKDMVIVSSLDRFAHEEHDLQTILAAIAAKSASVDIIQSKVGDTEDA